MLFDVVPDSFFRPLAAPGKIVYWDCICRLFEVTGKQLSFGVERDVLVDELTYYFDSSMAADIPEEDASSAETITSSRDKANFILRRLESYGWIYVDVDYSYVQRVNFRDYAIKLIKTLTDISGQKRTEYQGYIYTIYSLAKSTSNPGIALTQIVENMDALITGLKTLNANIKKYIDDLTKHSTVAEILDALLNDYYSNIVDRAYHRLLTSDNVSKFRPEIVEKLEADSRSNRYLKNAARELSELREITVEEAHEQVLTMLHDVIEAFRQMDQILDEINKKNTRYQRAAINRARFLLTSSEDIRGQLKNILMAMNEYVQDNGQDYNAVYELEEMDKLIRLYSWEYLDMDSLYEPVEGKKEFVPQELSRNEADEKARLEKRRQMEEKLERILSPEKINRYVKEQMHGRPQMLASAFPLEGEGFIRLIYIRLYGQRKNMGYRIDTEADKIVQKDGYRFRDFVVIAGN